MNFKRQDNETYVSFMKRIVNGVRVGEVSYEEMGDYLLGADNCYSSENLRKCYYLLDKIVDRLDDVICTGDEMLSEISRQKDELYKERVRLRDKVRARNKSLTEDARFENLCDILKERLDEMPPVVMESQQKIVNGTLEASLLVSDIHYGLKIDNMVNLYDKEVCRDRLNELADKTMYYCEKNKVGLLHVELLGDLCSGIINVSNRVEEEEDVIAQIVEVAELLAAMIRKLQTKIPKVDVYAVFGNHGRAIPNKKESLTRENLERLVFHYLKLRLPNVKVITSENEDLLTVKIAGRSMVLTHGTNDTPSSAVTNCVRVLGYKPDEIHMGHLHTFGWEDDNDSDVIVNGSLVGTDVYAMDIRKSTKPSQTLRIYDTDTICVKIILNE